MAHSDFIMAAKYYSNIVYCFLGTAIGGICT
jgi:hypothetical protein